MENERELVDQRLGQWVASMQEFRLPDWDSLPQLELYMDQVIVLLKRYLGPLSWGGEEKAITASIINNYVRLKVMPPPVKKRYGRVHLACLIIICILKQNLSISNIQRMLPEDHSEEAVRRLYNDFVEQYHLVSGKFVHHMQDRNAPLNESGSPITSAAIISNLFQGLTEYLLQPPQEREPGKKSE